MSRVIKRNTRRMQSGAHEPKRAYNISRTLSKQLNKRTAIMKIHADTLAHNVAVMDESLAAWLAWLVKHKAPVQGKGAFVEAVANLRGAVSGTIPSIRSFCEIVEDTRTHSDVMDLAGGKVIHVMTSIRESMERIVRVCNVTQKQLGRLGD
jgi:hypothetical protein